MWAVGELRIEKKEWTETWIDSKGRQLDAAEYRDARSRRGFFRAWADNDTAYRLLNSGYKYKTLFARRVQLGRGQNFLQDVKIDEPGVYEVSWNGLDAQGKPVRARQTVYCIDLDNSSVSRWNLKEVVWLEPRKDAESSVGILLLPDAYRFAWVVLRNPEGKSEVQVRTIENASVILRESDFPNLWETATALEVGLVDDTELIAQAFAFRKESPDARRKPRLAQHEVPPGQRLSIALTLPEAESSVSRGWIVLSPDWNDSVQQSFFAESQKSQQTETINRWNASFDLAPYYFPNLSVGQLTANPPSNRLAESRTVASAVSLIPFRGARIKSVISQVALKDGRRIVRSLEAPAEAGGYKVHFGSANEVENTYQGASELFVRTPLNVEVSLPSWARVGDVMEIPIQVTNLSAKSVSDPLEIELAYANGTRDVQLVETLMEPDQSIAASALYEIDALSEGDAELRQRLATRDWRSEGIVEISKDTSEVSMLYKFEELEKGLWKSDLLPLSRLETIQLVFNNQQFTSVLERLCEGRYPSFSPSVIRDALFAIAAGNEHGDLPDQHYEKLISLIREDGSASFSSEGQGSLFWSSFVYGLLNDQYLRMGQPDGVFQSLEAYLLTAAGDNRLASSTRAWLLYVLSHRLAYGGATMSMGELSSYQSLWRIRSNLPEYVYWLMATASENYGLKEDKLKWIALAEKASQMDAQSDDRLLRLISRERPFFAEREARILSSLLSQKSENPISRLSLKSASGSLDRSVLLEQLVRLMAVSDNLKDTRIQTSPIASEIQLRLSDRILSDDDFDILIDDLGLISIQLNEALKEGAGDAFVAISLGGDHELVSVIAEVTQLPNSRGSLRAERSMKHIRRVNSLLNGVTEHEVMSDLQNLELVLSDRLEMELKFRTDVDLENVSLYEPIPAGLRIGASELVIMSRSGRALPSEQVHWNIGKDGVEAHIQNLPAGQWSIRYRMSPQALGVYHSGMLQMYTSEPEHSEVFLESYKVTIRKQVETGL